MSVYLEFTVANEDFTLGRVLSGTPGIHLELERIVPTGTQVVPFVWVTGDQHEAFENRVRDIPEVKELVALDRVDDRVLYRIIWEVPSSELIKGIAESDATILEAEGDEKWVFRLRFSDHENLTTFNNYCTDHHIPIHVERTYTFSEESDQMRQFGLSVEQREALVLALRRGYFDTPKEITLDKVASELGISRQALSTRIRRGNEKILRRVLLSSADDLD